MRRRIRPTIRNKLDLAEPVQVRIVKRKLGLSALELAEMVAKGGNSLAAAAEVGLRRASPTTTVPADVPAADVIDATQKIIGPASGLPAAVEIQLARQP